MILYYFTSFINISLTTVMFPSMLGGFQYRHLRIRRVFQHALLDGLAGPCRAGMWATHSTNKQLKYALHTVYTSYTC